MKDNQPKSLRTLKSYVDKLGKLKAQIRELEDQVSVLRTEILNSEQDKIVGSLFKANIVNYSCTMVSWKTIVQESNVPQSIIDQHTNVQERSRITLAVR